MNNTLKIGDRVSFTYIVKKSSGFSIKSRDGKIAQIHDDFSIVSYRGKRIEVPVSELRHIGTPSALTEAFNHLKE